MNKKNLKRAYWKNCTQLISGIIEICIVVIQEINHLRTLEGADKKVIKSDTEGRDAAKKVHISISITSR